MAAEVPLWLLALVLAAVGIGFANTGPLGLLVQAVPIERIVTAMVVWSQIGIIGCLSPRSQAASSPTAWAPASSGSWRPSPAYS